MNRFAVRVGLWAALLALGFVAIFTLGRPVLTDQQELDAALHPQPPVSQLAAEQSAETIVRLQFDQLVGAPREVLRKSDFGVDRWVITYTADGPTLNGVTISVAIESGRVEVASYP
jgi:hypothetical protein